MSFSASNPYPLTGNHDVKVNVNYVTEQGTTPLMNIAKTKLKAPTVVYVIDCLLKAKADVDAKDKYGDTALSLAVQHKNVAAVFQLVNAKANVNSCHTSGYTPLLWATKTTQGNVAVFLINHKAEVKVSATDSYTPLLWAADKSLPKAVRSLVKAQARVEHANGYGSTALHLAARRNHAEIAQCLIKAKAGVNVGDNYGETPMMHAIYHDNPHQLLRVLITPQAELHQTDRDHQSVSRKAELLGGHRKAILDKVVQENNNMWRLG